MNTNRLVLLLMIVSITFSCNKNDDEVNTEIDANFVSRTFSTNYPTCVNPDSTDCIPELTSDIEAEAIPPRTDGYIGVVMTFPNAQNQEEVDCIRNQYFFCHPELRLSILQSTVFNKKQVWMFPDIIGTGDPISADIDNDDRVCRGPNCG